MKLRHLLANGNLFNNNYLLMHELNINIIIILLFGIIEIKDYL